MELKYKVALIIFAGLCFIFPQLFVVSIIISVLLIVCVLMGGFCDIISESTKRLK